MSSLLRSKSELGKETADAGQTFQSLNDLYLLELSQACAQAVEAGMITPEVKAENLWAFQFDFCPQHQLALLPSCPACSQGGQS